METDNINQCKPGSLFRETVLLCVLFGCLCFPLIFSKQECNYSQDETSFHLPAVRQISAHWPSLDVANDSLSATAPGYHYFLATVSFITGQNVVTLRLVNWAVSTLVLVVLYRHVRRLLPRLDSTLILLPLAFSNFFVKSASWVVTDNAALLLVTLCLLSCLKQRTRARQNWTESLLICASVFIRQMTVWLLGLPWAAALASPTAERRRRLMQAGVGTLPPLAVLAFLAFRWSGLVPPAWRDTSTAVSLVGPVYLLSVFSTFAIFYLPSQPSAPTRLLWKFTLGGAAVFGFVLSLFPSTIPDYATGRWGGYLWNLAGYCPSPGGRNLLFVTLCTIGTVWVARIWLMLSVKENIQAATVFLAGLTAWAATFVVNRQVFHRYFEPTILVFLIALVPMLVQGAPNLRRWRLGLAFCSAVQLALTLATAHLSIWR